MTRATSGPWCFSTSLGTHRNKARDPSKLNPEPFRDAASGIKIVEVDSSGSDVPGIGVAPCRPAIARDIYVATVYVDISYIRQGDKTYAATFCGSLFAIKAKSNTERSLNSAVAHRLRSKPSGSRCATKTIFRFDRSPRHCASGISSARALLWGRACHA